MGLSSALNTSVNGLNLTETAIDVIGNNIANAGTNGFKASRTLFSTQLAQTLSVGSAANGSNGGTNPRQIGLGALNSAIQVDFSQGNITNSTSPSDMAIQGDGFFVVSSNGATSYTRNGNFTLNSNDILTNSDGSELQGYGINKDFQLVTSSVQPIKVPLGTMQVAAATTQASIKGALFSSGTVATQGSLLDSAALVDGSGNPITSSTLLSDVRLASAPATTEFAAGQTLNLTPQEAGSNLDTQKLNVTATTTVGDLLTSLTKAMGLQTTGTPPIPVDADGIPVGATVTAGGQIQIKGNRGTANDVAMPVGSITGPGGAVDLGFVSLQQANGESTTTTYQVYDSLGQAVNVRMTAVLESVAPNLTTFRYYVQNPDVASGQVAVGNSILTFDGNGNLTGSPNNTFAFDRSTTAATSPQQVTLDFSGVSGISTSSAGSTLSLASQDGSAPGTLTNFVIDQTGTVNGVFDNGLIKPLGQIVLARFSNPDGLLQSGNNNFTAGVASGLPVLATPGSFGAGTVRAGAIELSNTDVGKSLVDLIVASTNYQGNTRVLTSVNQLVDQLLQIGR
jgi:flagellar hook protein FlgE